MTHHSRGWFATVLCLSAALALAPATATEDSDEDRVITVHIPKQHPQEHGNYYLQLLKKTLEQSKSDGESFHFEEITADYPQARWIHELQHRPSDDNMVFWTATTQEREAQIRPIRIPLLKGLLGYRAFIIREDDQARFDAIESLEELAQLRAGQHDHWPDTQVLRHNDLTVTTFMDHEALFKMLQGGRFDYFPRGIAEAWEELEERRDAPLTLEQRLLLYYPQPIYFFVSPDNSELAERIERGLVSLLENGDFDAFFHSHPPIQQALQDVASRPRKILQLNNPLLPEETPLDNNAFWHPLDTPTGSVTP